LGPLGQFRLNDEDGAAIGQTVKLENGSNVKSVQELGQELAADPRIGFCLSQNLTKYALRGSYATTANTQCQTENTLYQAYKNGNGMKNYLEAVILSPLFSRKLEIK
jgi:hypothetical protein